ncbi:MAG: uracil-DNA glycosylase [Clostridiales bacterium]|nr:uracil-DNA glycosylase [Clostridiales bacterium]MBQ6270690.1 uracil-DNA glycosylase [Clostridiales bacterium]MBR4009504.1 uracil-DNA glycosylase [Clostridiales bacterium]MCR5057177.1 uracil-DNA glycosylase [Clostridiales bacterium]
MKISWSDFVEQCNTCEACPLAKTRKNVVIYRGSAVAPIMFVGEGPGATEDEQGLPFVGQAGRLLQLLLDAQGFSAKDFHIANVVKCRPPENRVPTDAEAAACKKLLGTQILLCKPKIIVLLGKTAYTLFTGDKNAKMTQIRGAFIEKNGYLILPTFHPAYILRNNNERVKLWKDIEMVRKKAEEMGLMEPLPGAPDMPTERPSSK